MSVDRVRGCLIGGAVADALGAGVEFLKLDEIRSRFGLFGIGDYTPAYGRRGAITDDTQMTLFTAEGLIRAWARFGERGICHPPSIVHHAYLRWLLTPGEQPIKRDLPSIARNHSKGCGGVVRAAPVGLLKSVIGELDAVFEEAVKAAALTHGHPTGSLAAGYFAATIAGLVSGATLDRALDDADELLRHRPQGEEVARAVAGARALAAQGSPTPERVETLGAGWVAEEALAIAVYSARVAAGFADGVLLAVNHSGDSDSAGSMTGNLLGALYGLQVIPSRWLEALELREEMKRWNFARKSSA